MTSSSWVARVLGPEMHSIVVSRWSCLTIDTQALGIHKLCNPVTPISRVTVDHKTWKSILMKVLTSGFCVLSVQRVKNIHLITVIWYARCGGLIPWIWDEGLWKLQKCTFKLVNGDMFLHFILVSSTHSFLDAVLLRRKSIEQSRKSYISNVITCWSQSIYWDLTCGLSAIF